MSSALTRPEPSEYPPFFAGYIALVPDGDSVSQLVTQLVETLALLRGIDATTADHRYAPGKWSIKEVVGHICDVERVMAYRALRFSRADTTEVEGFEENEYVEASRFASMDLADLATTLDHVRQSTVDLFRGMDSNMAARSGVANGASVSVRALAFVIAGHERHHVALLKERYL